MGVGMLLLWMLVLVGMAELAHCSFLVWVVMVPIRVLMGVGMGEGFVQMGMGMCFPEKEKDR